MRLRDLAIKHGTDKAGHHEYCEKYEMFLNKYKGTSFKLLEIGVGGYHYPKKGGQSLRMWQEYFPDAEIHAIDVYPKSFVIPGVGIHKGSQDDGTFLNQLIKTIGRPDVIIDDGSHINALTVQSFRFLFPHLKPGGTYIVEDTHTSYWDRLYGGGWHNGTIIEFLKRQIDGLNSHCWRELPEGADTPSDNIESLHFFTEIAFIIKKQNAD